MWEQRNKSENKQLLVDINLDIAIVKCTTCEDIPKSCLRMHSGVHRSIWDHAHDWSGWGNDQRGQSQGLGAVHGVETEGITHHPFLTITGLSGVWPQRCLVTVTRHEHDMPCLHAQIVELVYGSSSKTVSSVKRAGFCLFTNVAHKQRVCSSREWHVREPDFSSGWVGQCNFIAWVEQKLSSGIRLC